MLAFAHQGGGKYRRAPMSPPTRWRTGRRAGSTATTGTKPSHLRPLSALTARCGRPRHLTTQTRARVRPLRREGGRGHVLLVPADRELAHREGAVESSTVSSPLRSWMWPIRPAASLHRASMAQDRLTGAARGGISRTGTGQVSIILAGAVLIGGTFAEAATPGPVTPLTGADFAVGSCYAAVGAWLLRARRRGHDTARSGADRPAGGPAAGWLALAVAAAWFLGTAAAARGLRRRSRCPRLPGHAHAPASAERELPSARRGRLAAWVRAWPSCCATRPCYCRCPRTGSPRLG